MSRAEDLNTSKTLRDKNPICANPGLNLKKTYGVNPRVTLIGLRTTRPSLEIVDAKARH